MAAPLRDGGRPRRSAIGSHSAAALDTVVPRAGAGPVGHQVLASDARPGQRDDERVTGAPAQLPNGAAAPSDQLALAKR